MVLMWVLSVVLFLAVVFDLKQRRVPNYLIVVSLVVVFTYRAVKAPHSIPNALIGLSAALLVFFPFFVFRVLGAGDVKLMAVAGSVLGWPDIAWLTIITMMMGGVLAVIAMVFNGSIKDVLSNIRNLFVALVMKISGAPVSLGLDSALKIPYALAIALAYVTWIIFIM